MSLHQTEPPELNDILIIGAGPCSLAVATRLQEQTPSALYTDVEHQRYHWIKKHSGRMNVRPTRAKGGIKSPSTPKTSVRRPQPGYDTVIYDASSDAWMTSWKNLFRALEIEFLRSPLFFHPDPRDRDGLLAFAYEKGRENELEEIRSVVGKELSKHRKKKKMKDSRNQRSILEIDERDRKDYFRPSTALFNDFCESIVDRYGLRNAVHRAEIQSVEYGFVENESVPNTEKVFAVQTSAGVTYARAVVLAIGMGVVPRMPTTLLPHEVEGACHSSQVVENEFPPSHIRHKIAQGAETNVVVVGGGLTSAQIADLAIRKGVSKVWQLMRGEFKVKPFDVALDWMGKYQNVQKSAFWSADSDKERLQIILLARNGGSITPPFAKIMNSHIESSKLTLLTHTTIASKQFSPLTRSWSISITTITTPASPVTGAGAGAGVLLPPIDYIVYCTGKTNDVNLIPFLEPVRRQHPIDTEGGFPCLTPDLAWSEHVPLFVTGQLAALRLGPGAGNLEGAREGAERVVCGLEAWLVGRGGSGTDSEQENECDERKDLNNHFEVIA